MSNIIAKFFGSPLFTWWNSATVGTRYFTRFHGIKVGEDSQGNIYYTNKAGDRRWVIYKNGDVEASRIPPEWHAWIHKTVNVPPSEDFQATNEWEKDHTPNLTGTDNAYFAASAITKDGSRVDQSTDYEAWKP